MIGEQFHRVFVHLGKMSETKLVDLCPFYTFFKASILLFSVVHRVQLSKSCLPANIFSDFFYAYFLQVFSMKEELRAGKNHRCFEEIINYCNEYEKDIEKVDHQNQDMFHQHHQFGAISFYSHTSTSSTATPGKSSPGNTLQHKRQENWFAVKMHKWGCDCVSFIFEESYFTPAASRDQFPVKTLLQDKKRLINCVYSLENSILFETSHAICSQLQNSQFKYQNQRTEVYLHQFQKSDLFYSQSCDAANRIANSPFNYRVL